MKRKTLATFLTLAMVAGCGAGHDPVPAQSAREPLGSAVALGALKPITLYNLFNSGAPADQAAAFDDVSGFPIRASDRVIPLGQFAEMLRDAVVRLAGVLAPTGASADVEQFLQYVGDKTMPHRKNVRLVQINTDAPVYLVGSWAILPDDNNAPIDPASFRSGGGYNVASVSAFCAANPGRCISLLRNDPSNNGVGKNVGLILLAARNIIVKGANYTDGLSLVTVTENLIMSEEGDHLNLSAGVAQPQPWGSTSPHPASVPAVEIPAEVTQTGAKAGNGSSVANADSQWQLNRSRDLTGSSVPDARRGLAGLHGGSIFMLTYRRSGVRIQSNGQTGGDGVGGMLATPQCSKGKWSDFPQNNNWQMPSYILCDPQDSLWDGNIQYSGGDAYCNDLCPIDACQPESNPNAHNGCDKSDNVRQDGGPSGPAGLSGMVYLYAVSTVDNCSGFYDGDLRDDGFQGRDPLTRYDVEGQNNGCFDCNAGTCGTNVNVTVCGTHERDQADRDAASRIHVVGLPSIGGGTAVSTNVPMALNVSAPILGGLGGLGGNWCFLLDNVDQFVYDNGSDGTPGKAGGAALVYCDEPNAPWCDNYRDSDGNLSFHGGPVRCRAATNGIDGGRPPSSPFYGPYGKTNGTWSRLAWAIAVNRLHPMELDRRISVAARRYKQGELSAAALRYRDAQFLIAANQRRVMTGNYNDGRMFNCDVAKDPGFDSSGWSAEVKEVCGERLEVDRRLRSINRGENFYGYPPNFLPPASIHADGSTGWVQLALDQMKDARAAITAWSTNARLQYLDGDVQATWSLGMDADMTTLEQTYTGSNGQGSLKIALDQAKSEHDAAVSKLGTLHAQMAVLNNQIGTLQHPVTKKPFSLDDLEKFVISKGVGFAITALAPEIAPAAFALSDALASGLDNDLSISGAKIFSSKDDASKWVSGQATSLAKDAFGISDSAQVASGGDSDASKAMKIAGLRDDVTQLMIQEREMSRTLGQSIRDIQLINAKINEARATVLRLQAQKAQFGLNRYGVDYLDQMLKAQFAEAVAKTQRAGELAFLAKRATEHDLATWTLKPDGTQVDELNPLLDKCGGVDADSWDVRFEEGRTSCIDGRLQRLKTFLLAQAQAFPFPVNGHVTVVAPITLGMRRIDSLQGAVYDVPVDVALDQIFAQPAYNMSRAQMLRDFSIFVDTGATGRAPGNVVRDSNEAVWLGVTSADLAPGGDPGQYLRYAYARGGTTLDADGILAPLFTSPEWKEVPRLTMDLCRGSAASNQAIIDGNGQIPLQCKLTNDPVASKAYVGRSLLGRYTVTVPESILVSPLTSAVRMDFQFTAKDASTCMPAPSCASTGLNCGAISDGCGGTLTCGSCGGTDSCGGGGHANVCGCTPTTCAARGVNCGTIPDGCGGTLTCGTCGTGDTCGGGGTANVCGHPCVPRRHICSGANACQCFDDGCGGESCCPGLAGKKCFFQ